jgi:hypothetical protein
VRLGPARTAAQVVPVALILGWLVPLVEEPVVVYLLVGTIALCAWLLGAVMGLAAATPDRSTHPERTAP